MKELFNKLSNLFKFSTESRLVYQKKAPQPQPTQEEVKEKAKKKVSTSVATPPSTPEEGVAKAKETGQLKPRGFEKVLEEFEKRAKKESKEVKVETAGVVGKAGERPKKGPDVVPGVPGEKPEEKPRMAVDTESVEEVEE